MKLTLPHSFLAVSLVFLSPHLLSAYDYQDWNLVWSDEFREDGLPNSQKWSYDSGGDGWGNNELQFYTEQDLDNARVEDGKLIIEARRESFFGNNYTSARLVTRGKGDWLYGRIEVRAKLPQGRGTWPAIWMLPTDWEYGNWPNSGEIDIMEHVGYDMNVVHATVHTERFNHVLGTQVGTSINPTSVDQQFHTYSLEWRPNRIDVFLDEILYFSFQNDHTGSGSWPFDKRFHLLLNIAVGGNWGGVEGVDDSIFPQRMEVDYVRVYASNDPQMETVQSIPGSIQIAQSSDQNGIDVESTQDVNAGLNLGWIQEGDSVTYTTETQNNGNYDLFLRYASPQGSTGIDVWVDGASVLKTATLESSGGWQSWINRSIGTIPLSAGRHEVQLRFTGATSDDLNISRIAFFETTDAVHKFLNPETGAYFFTGFQQEARQVLMNLPQWIYQGTSFGVEYGQTNENLPVYRFFNQRSGSHFYTANEDEKNNVIANLSHQFSYEGVAFYVRYQAQGTDLITQQTRAFYPVYRCFLPPTSSHFFTANETEVEYIRNFVSPEIMRVESIAWYTDKILNE